MTLSAFEIGVLAVVAAALAVAGIQYWRGVIGVGRWSMAVGGLLAGVSALLVRASVEGPAWIGTDLDVAVDVVALLVALVGLALLYRSLRHGWWRDGVSGP